MILLPIGERGLHGISGAARSPTIRRDRLAALKLDAL